MKFVTMTAAAALLGAGTAFAGGIMPAPSEPLVMAPAAPMMVDDWTGGYAGLTLGYGSADVTGSDLLEDGDGTDDDILDQDGDGIVGGVILGYQQDFGQFVLGAEADLNASNIDFDEDDFFGGDIDLDDDGEPDGGASIDQIHVLKLRAGYDLGNALVYGTAGAAYAKADIDGIGDVEDVGYVLGAGVDYKITPNVIVGGEVLYHEFEEFDDTGIDLDVTTVKARVAYKF